jgi:hypothetical protein
MHIERKLLLALVIAGVSAGCDTSSEAPPAVASEDLQMFPGSVDHAGIVESTTMMLVAHTTEFATVLDPYNREDPFAIHASSYVDAFDRNLRRFDARDGKSEWTSAQTTRWAQRMAAGNYQVIDTSMPCDYAHPHTYLEIERAQLTGARHATCGGRMPNEDAMDVTLNFLIRGPAASSTGDGAIHDGIEQATQRSTDTFPYLADLNE